MVKTIFNPNHIVIVGAFKMMVPICMKRDESNYSKFQHQAFYYLMNYPSYFNENKQAK